jgi:hypothetical protein
MRFCSVCVHGLLVVIDVGLECWLRRHAGRDARLWRVRMRRYAGGKGVTKVLHGGVSCFAGTRHHARRRTNAGDVILQSKSGGRHRSRESQLSPQTPKVSHRLILVLWMKRLRPPARAWVFRVSPCRGQRGLVMCLGLFSLPRSAASLACCTWLISLAARPHQDHPHQDRPAGNTRFGSMEPCSSWSSEDDLMNKYKHFPPADYYPQPPYL